MLQLVNKRQGGAFDADDEELLAAIATHLSHALNNATLYRDALDATRHSEAVLASCEDWCAAAAAAAAAPPLGCRPRVA